MLYFLQECLSLHKTWKSRSGAAFLFCSKVWLVERNSMGQCGDYRGNSFFYQRVSKKIYNLKWPYPLIILSYFWRLLETHIFEKRKTTSKLLALMVVALQMSKESVAVASHWPACRDHQDNITSTIHTSTVHQGKLEFCKNCIVFQQRL